MEQNNVRVKIKTAADGIVAVIGGEIDHHSATCIRREIDEAYLSGGGGSMVLDMSQVKFMDSSGLGLILGRFAKVSACGGSFCVLDPSESVRRVLDIAGAGRLIDICVSEKN